MEGALKLKEISYIHAEGYPAGEMKHGPISLIDEDVPVVAIVPRDSMRDKMLSNINEVRARGGSVIAVATEGDAEVEGLSDDLIEVPVASETVNPFSGVAADAVDRVPHRGQAGMRRGPAEESGEDGYGGIGGAF